MSNIEISEQTDDFLSFNGRITRESYFLRAFWLTVPVTIIFLFAAKSGARGAIIFTLLLVFICSFLLTVQFIKRLHDISLNGWYWFLGLVPVLNLVFGIYVMAKDGTPGPNEYGEDAKGRPPVVVNEEGSDGKRINSNSNIETSEANTMTKQGVTVSRVIVVTWALVLLGLFLYVPFQDLWANGEVNYRAKDLAKYDWVFTVENREYLSRINYDLWLVTMGVWTSICWALAYTFKRG